MNTRIAAFFDATNMLSDVTSGRFVSVYSKINNKWKAVDRFTLSEVVFSSIDQPELYAKELLKQLGNIDVIVAKSFGDLYYNEFLKNNVAVATAHNFGKGLLKKILLMEKQKLVMKKSLKRLKKHVCINILCLFLKDTIQWSKKMVEICLKDKCNLCVLHVLC